MCAKLAFLNILQCHASIHKTHHLILFAAIESSINVDSLSVTGLGRNIDNKAS